MSENSQANFTRDVGLAHAAANLLDKHLDTQKLGTGEDSPLKKAQGAQALVLDSLEKKLTPPQYFSREAVPKVPSVPKGDRDIIFKLGEFAADKELREIIDSKTGLLNERGYHLALADKIADVRRRNFVAEPKDKKGLGFVFFDAIGLKTINDNLGHPSGDLTIQTIAQKLSSCIRRGQDILARPAGDEFMFVGEVSRQLDLERIADLGYKDSLFANINEKVLGDLTEKLPPKYSDYPGMGSLRAEGFYLSPADLELSSEELDELIVKKLGVVSSEMKKTKRKG